MSHYAEFYERDEDIRLGRLIEESKKVDNFETLRLKTSDNLDAVSVLKAECSLAKEPYQIKVGDRLVLKEKFDKENFNYGRKESVLDVASGKDIVVTSVSADQDGEIQVYLSNSYWFTLDEFKSTFNVIPAHYYGLVEELQ